MTKKGHQKFFGSENGHLSRKKRGPRKFVPSLPNFAPGLRHWPQSSTMTTLLHLLTSLNHDQTLSTFIFKLCLPIAYYDNKLDYSP